MGTASRLRALFAPLVVSSLYLGAVGAGAALANPPIDHVRINGTTASPCNKGYCSGGNAVSVGASDAGRQVDVVNNNEDGGNDIIEVDLTLLTAPNQNLLFTGRFSSGGTSTPCAGTGNGRELFCTPPKPLEADDAGFVGYTSDHPVTSGLVVDVNFNQCAGMKRDARMAFGLPLPAAADRCKPPSGTKFTSTRINGSTAVFKFKARNATGFRCSLFANGRVVRRHSCRSPQSVGPLPPGQYLFTVAGHNRAGYDKPAKKRFAIA